MFEIIHGDSVEKLKDIPSNSIDSIVTDPPYGISFMGKDWDKQVPGADLWAECHRVLKPEGVLLAFAGTRTQHRMASEIEKGGFFVSGVSGWAYGTGFPKNLDVSKAIDKQDAVKEKTEMNYKFTNWFVDATVLTNREIDELCGTNGMAGHWTCINGVQPSIPTRDHFETLRPHIKMEIPQWVEDLVNQRTVESKNLKAREVVGTKRKPDFKFSPCCGDDMPQQDIEVTKPKTPDAIKWEGWGTSLKKTLEPITIATKMPETSPNLPPFIYNAKIQKKDRGEGNNHPTVKPTELMRVLCELVTPEGGTILDPFAGSGSTGRGAVLGGFDFIGIELDSDFCEIASKRIKELTIH